MFGRNKIAALVAEFLGTGILTLLVLSVQRSTIGVPFFVALAAGLTITVLYFALGEVSGGHFNPAITIALATARKVAVGKAIVYVAVQLLGAWLAYWLYTYYANNHLMPIGGHFTWRILVAEGVGTAILGFGYAAAVYQGYSTAVRASVAGIAYVVAVVAASAAAIGLVNPAIALGVRAWIWGSYVAGPVIGAIVGVNLYRFLFAGVSEVAPPIIAAATVITTPTTKTVVTKTTTLRKPAKAAATKTTGRKTTKKVAIKRAPRTKK
jgi:glycerol uptake facilitator-like aquaporin